ncbi:uncharacterized protein N7496_009723 [Penicillium cataractarum]|uniref:Uncharacterized protein n=1 Tax=Penicillium cataractarum TaxID=2100454 RepID=A0A9W9RPG5_9EURO|nr:uncharacterized protein N7496_009723 [Penicillium cataractarum]KAJ5364010.1 hypothetical protein N7496_009723 [Penicillium cataractarum]
MSEYSGSLGEAVIQRSPGGYDENLDDLGVGNQLNELGFSGSEDKGSSDMEALRGSGIDRNCSDSQLSDTAIVETGSYMDKSYDEQDPYQHEPCQYNEVEAMAVAREMERKVDARDRQELHQGPNVRWVNVRFSEHEGHLTGYRLLLKMKSAIQSQEATITMEPQCAGGPFWVSIEVVGLTENERASYGGFGSRGALLSAAKDIVVAWLGRVHDEGLPFEKDVVFRKVHGQESTLRLNSPPKKSPPKHVQWEALVERNGD